MLVLHISNTGASFQLFYCWCQNFCRPFKSLPDHIEIFLFNISPILVWKHHNIITIFEELCVGIFIVGRPKKAFIKNVGANVHPAPPPPKWRPWSNIRSSYQTLTIIVTIIRSVWHKPNILYIIIYYLLTAFKLQKNYVR